MYTRLYLFFLFLATPAFSQDFSVTLGVSDWVPRLQAVQEELQEVLGQPLEGDRGTNRYINLSSRAGSGWQTVYYTQWQGGVSQHPFRLRINNWGFTYGRRGPLGVNGGIGGNLLQLKRTGAPIVGTTSVKTQEDRLWGLHATGGFLWSFMRPFSLELRYTWQWTKSAYLDGLEYDLGGGMWSAAMGFEL